MVPVLGDRCAVKVVLGPTFIASGGSGLGDYLAKRSDEVSEALFTVTDNMAGASERATIVKVYQTVRGGAGKNIEVALPSLGAMVQKCA